jgi:hypothetical protein
MKTVGEIREICEQIEKEHGSDCPVVLQIYGKGQKLKEGEYCNGYGIQGDGTLFLFNSK